MQLYIRVWRISRILPVEFGARAGSHDAVPCGALRVCGQGADQGDQGGVPPQGRLYPDGVSRHQKTENVVQETATSLSSLFGSG